MYSKFEGGIPSTEIISCNFNGFPRFISRIYLRVDHMGLCQCNLKKIVNVRWKALKAGFVSKEAMNIN
jgi:hypothetical protein